MDAALALGIATLSDEGLNGYPYEYYIKKQDIYYLVKHLRELAEANKDVQNLLAIQDGAPYVQYLLSYMHARGSMPELYQDILRASKGYDISEYVRA